MKQRVVFAWEWGAGVGHLASFAPIAQRLVAAGVDVVLAVRDVSNVRRFYAQPNYAVRQAPTISTTAHRRFHEPRTFAGIAWNLGYNNPSRVESLIEAWRGLLTDVRASLVVCDFGLGASLASHSLNIPWVRFGNGFFCPPDVSPLASLRFPVDRVPPHEARAEWAILEMINDAMKRFGSRELSVLADSFGSPERTLLATVPEFDAYVRRTEKHSYLGPLDACTGTAPRWRHHDSVKAVAYLKPSTQATDFVSALCSAGVEVIAAGGIAGLAESGEVSHPLLHFHHDLIDLPAAAEQCDFFVNNGNHGTTLRMLVEGVPVVALPMYIEQRLTSHRLAEHGLGVYQRGDKQLTGCIDAVLSMTCRENVRLFAERYDSVFDSAESAAFNQLVRLHPELI